MLARSMARRSASFLLSPTDMRTLWWIPMAFVAVGAGAWFRARRRRKRELLISQPPVSGEWLARARGKEEHTW